jgi:hypothetical protein
MLARFNRMAVRDGDPDDEPAALSVDADDRDAPNAGPG